MHAIWMRHSEMVVPCPNCGGKVWFGADYDWLPELGGEWMRDLCVCEQCKAEWTEATAPKDFSTPDGEFWNVVDLNLEGE